MATHMTLGQRVRLIRLKKGMSQVELAKGICTPSLISQIESDRANPSHKMLLRLAEKLDTSLQTFLTDVELNLNFLSQYKMAQALMKSGEYVLAISMLEDLVTVPKHELSIPSITFDLANSYFHNNQLKKAQELFEQLREHFVVAQDREKLAETLYWLGMIEYKEKRYQLAIYNFQKARTEVEQAKQIDFVLKANLLFRLARSHVALGQICESMEFFDAAETAFNEKNDLRGLAKVYSSSAEAYARGGKFEKSVQLSEKAISIYDSLEFMLKHAKMLMHAGVARYKMGERVLAVEMLHDAIQKLKLYGTPKDVSIALVELAQIKLDLGEIDQAEELCETAVHDLPAMHSYRGFVYRVKGKIAHTRGDQETAIQLMISASECFKNENQYSEWCCTMEEVASIYREAFNLKRAVEILEHIRTTTREKLHERGIVL